MKYIFLFFLLLFGSVCLYAQDESEDEYEYYYPLVFQKYSIGFSPSAFVNFYSGIQFSQDFGIKPNVNLTLETGYIFSSAFLTPVNGLRIKPGFQYLATSNEFVAFLVGASFNYRYINEQRESIFNHFEDGYLETVRFDRIKHFTAAEFNLSVLAKVSEVIRIEFGLGIGAGSLSIEDKNTTQKRTGESSFVLFGREFDTPGKTIMPLASFNLNIQYALVSR